MMGKKNKRVRTAQIRALEIHWGQLDTQYDVPCSVCGKRAVHRVTLPDGTLQFKHTRKVRTPGRTGFVNDTSYCETKTKASA